MALQLQIRSLNGKTLSSPGLFGAGVAVFVCHFHVPWKSKVNSEFGRDGFQLDVKGAYHGGRCHAAARNAIWNHYLQ